MLLVACGSTAPTPREPERQPEVIAAPREPVAPIVPRIDLDVPGAPTSLVVVGGTLWWTDSLGAVWSMPSDGSARAVQLSDATHPNFAFHLFRAGDQVFATSRGDLLRVGSEGVKALGVTGLDLPEESAGDASALYLTVFKRTSVLRVPLAGGAPRKLADVSRGVLGLHGDTLYAASYANGTLVAIPRAGGPVKSIAANLPRPTAVAADDTAVFVYCERDKAVRRIDLADGGVHVIARDLENSDDLLLDGAYVYTFTWGAAPGLVRFPRDGSHAMQRLTTDLKTPNKIAADGDAIYVSSRDQPRIVKLLKSALPAP
ncbi:hypothetical protein BH11MYX3_BH11MYX3_04420 [soil metagenome]